MYENYKDYVWGRYGFVDSYNLDKNWFSENVLAIDQGPILLMIENYLSQFVWNYFSKNKYVKKAMELVGFKEGSLELKPEEPPLIVADYFQGFSQEARRYFLRPEKTLEYGAVTSYPEDLDPSFRVNWDEENLYFVVEVRDNEVIAEEVPETLYRQDCIEIYFSPEELLFWGYPLHFQLGFAPSGKEDKPLKYAWFQERIIEEIELRVERGSEYYKAWIKIPFEILGIAPIPGKEISFSIAVHDFDRKDNSDVCKFNLFFMPVYREGSLRGFKLARLKLKR
jgi:hypothetical protein